MANSSTVRAGDIPMMMYAYVLLGTLNLFKILNIFHGDFYLIFTALNVRFNYFDHIILKYLRHR